MHAEMLGCIEDHAGLGVLGIARSRAHLRGSGGGSKGSCCGAPPAA
jgi:hypothetical protein